MSRNIFAVLSQNFITPTALRSALQQELVNLVPQCTKPGKAWKNSRKVLRDEFRRGLKSRLVKAHVKFGVGSWQYAYTFTSFMNLNAAQLLSEFDAAFNAALLQLPKQSIKKVQQPVGSVVVKNGTVRAARRANIVRRQTIRSKNSNRRKPSWGKVKDCTLSVSTPRRQRTFVSSAAAMKARAKYQPGAAKKARLAAIAFENEGRKSPEKPVSKTVTLSAQQHDRDAAFESLQAARDCVHNRIAPAILEMAQSGKIPPKARILLSLLFDHSGDIREPQDVTHNQYGHQKLQELYVLAEVYDDPLRVVYTFGTAEAEQLLQQAA